MAFPEPGTTWAGFRIESQIGAGGFGRVYAAWDPDLDRRVAIKVLNPEHLDSTERERFLRESRTAGGLDHPRILPIHQASEHEGVPYIVMRHVGGGDLRSALRQGPLTAARTASVISQIAEALDRAHRSGLVHRDVKPANILCAEGSDDVYLTDFGITRPMEESTDAGLTQSGRPPASPHYASPEQLRGEPLGPTTDVYSLGCTAFECLTGRVPFPGDSHIDVAHQQVHAAPPLVSRFRPDLPVELDMVLARAMAKDPADRPSSAGDLAAALAAVAVGGPTERPHPPAAVVPPPVASESPSRSVFDGPEDATAPLAPDPDATLAAPALAGDDVDDAEPGPPPTGIVEVDWDGWEDEPAPAGPRSRLPWIVGGVLAVAVVAVGFLVARAASTSGGDVDLGTDPTTTTTTEAEVVALTVDDVRALLPDGVDVGDCNPAPESAASIAGAVQLVCTREEAPGVLTFTLFPSGEDRDVAFDDAVDTLEIGGAGAGECALGDIGVHGFVGRDGSGRVACRVVGRRADFVWAAGAQPLLGTAGGEGAYAAQYDYWSDLVGRDDDAFPLPAEQALLDELVENHAQDCSRDVGLTLAAGGSVAVACRPDGEEPGIISWVRFDGPGAMAAWLDARRSSLPGTVDASPDACDRDVFGEPVVVESDDDDDRPGRGLGRDDDDPPTTEPAPDVGVARYDLDDSTGTVLCFVNSSDQNVLFWTRDQALIGSIAVTDAEERDMDELLKWFERDGHRP